MRMIALLLALSLAACGQADMTADARPIKAQIAKSPIQRCMNLGGSLESEKREGEWGYTVTYADLALMKAEGFDTVRLPIRWSSRASSRAPYKIDTRLFQRVDEIVDWAGQVGLNIIIDVHHFDELNQNPDRYEDKLIAMWDQIADHYAGAPPHLIFETINEPHSNMTLARVDRINRTLLKRIRVRHPNRWVIIGTGNWGSLYGLEKSDPPYDPRGILTFHYYEPFDFTHQGAPWHKPFIPVGQNWGTAAHKANLNKDLAKATAIQAQEGMPVFIGEFGVIDKAPASERAEYVRALRQAFEARGLGWCHWDWATTLGAVDLAKDEWKPGYRQALLGR